MFLPYQFHRYFSAALTSHPATATFPPEDLGGRNGLVAGRAESLGALNLSSDGTSVSEQRTWNVLVILNDGAKLPSLN